jgi:hypothetical protein
VTPSKPGGDRSYKRSWKNLLINKRYQLRFTLFMVGLASLLMVGLGFWVMRVANETTTVSMASVRGEACPQVPEIGAPIASEEQATTPVKPAMRIIDDPTDRAAPSVPPGPAPGSAASDPGTAAPDATGSAGSAAAGGEPTPPRGERRRVAVQIDESSLTLTVAVPPDFGDRVLAHWICEFRQAGTFERLERGRARILLAMIITGVLLVVGLAFYGIKMTHRVAGPLFKVSLYLSKMRGGRYDKVYNLRKGDQLVEFYDHFKLAHGGVVAMQQADITRLAELLAAAEAGGFGQHPAVVTLRELMARKEKSIE